MDSPRLIILEDARVLQLRRLITISISHYCEKARWALDRARLDYVEEGHIPNFHYLASFAVARSPFVPILVDAGRVIADSTDILHHVDAHAAPEARLFPGGELDAEVARLEARFDEVLGPASRAWAYWHWFGKTREVLRYATSGVPGWEQRVAPIMIGMAKRMTSWRLKITAESAERSLAEVHAVFSEVEGLLADGRRFLAGPRFTAADLTFAALAAPALLPPGHGVPLPPLEVAPDVMRAEVERLRETVAGRFALRLYAEDRRAT